LKKALRRVLVLLPIIFFFILANCYLFYLNIISLLFLVVLGKTWKCRFPATGSRLWSRRRP
jgi:hypothetical protein